MIDSITYSVFGDDKVRVKKGRKVRLVKLFSPFSTHLLKSTKQRWKQQYVAYASGWSASGSGITFYPSDAMLARVFATATSPSVCPSVRPSVCHTPVLCLAERKQDREMYTV